MGEVNMVGYVIPNLPLNDWSCSKGQCVSKIENAIFFETNLKEGYHTYRHFKKNSIVTVILDNGNSRIVWKDEDVISEEIVDVGCNSCRHSAYFHQPISTIGNPTNWKSKCWSPECNCTNFSSKLPYS